jgi:hypothetical protein
MPLFTKYQALMHLSGHMLYPCMLLFVLCAPLLLKFEGDFIDKNLLLQSVAVVSATFLGPPIMYVYAQTVLYSDWLRRLAYLPVFMVFGTGIAVNNTRAIFEAFLRVKSAFVRTPKYQIEKKSDTWLGKKYGPRAAWVTLFESLLAMYAFSGVYMLLVQWQWFDLFLFILALGLSCVAFWSLWEPFSSAIAGADDEATDDIEFGRVGKTADAALPRHLAEGSVHAAKTDTAWQ